MARVRWGNIVAIGRTRSVQEIQTCCVVKLTSGERETIPRYVEDDGRCLAE